MLKLRSTLGLRAPLAPLTYGELLGMCRDANNNIVSTYAVIMWSPTLPVAQRLSVLQPIPRCLVQRPSVDVLLKRKGDSYLSAGEVQSLTASGGALVECPDGSLRPLAEAVTTPDMYLPRALLDGHFKRHGDVVDNDGLARLHRLTLLPPEMIKEELAYRRAKADRASKKRRAVSPDDDAE